MGAINNFEAFEFLDFKNKYISETLSSAFLLYLLKILNLFFLIRGFLSRFF